MTSPGKAKVAIFSSLTPNSSGVSSLICTNYMKVLTSSIAIALLVYSFTSNFFNSFQVNWDPLPGDLI